MDNHENSFEAATPSGGDRPERSSYPARSKRQSDTVPGYDDVRIIRAVDGGALRTFSGGLAHENGWFASRKARRLLHWQGTAQLEYVMRAEVEFDVVRVATESVRIEFVGAEGPQVYTADIELIGTDGKVTLVEVKRDQRDLDDLTYRRKLRDVSRICQDRGMEFKVAFRKDVWANLVHRRNVTLFVARAFVTLEPVHLRRLDSYVDAEGDRATYGGLARALDPHCPRTGEAVVQALAVARRVQIDLKKPLLDATPLTIH